MKQRISILEKKVYIFAHYVDSDRYGSRGCLLLQDGQVIRTLKNAVIDGSKLDTYNTREELIGAVNTIPSRIRRINGTFGSLVGIEAVIKPFRAYKESKQGYICSKKLYLVRVIDPQQEDYSLIDQVCNSLHFTNEDITKQIQAAYGCTRSIFRWVSCSTDDLLLHSNCLQNIPWYKEACFARLFHNLENDGDYAIEVKVNKLPLDGTNLTWMDYTQLCAHIQLLIDELHLPLVFAVNEDETAFTVFLDARHLSCLQIKFTLCWIRYTYERPGSLFLMDAYRLKSTLYPLDSIFNLLLVPTQYFRSTNNAIREDQCISYFGGFVLRAELIENLFNETNRYLNSLFGEYNCLPILSRDEAYEDYKVLLTDESYLKRLPGYIQVYQQLINIK